MEHPAIFRSSLQSGFYSIFKPNGNRQSSHEAQRFFGLLARRAAGEPTQHLTGKQEFWGLEFEVTPDVLIPRPETEHVIEVALDRLAVGEVRAGRPPKTDGAGLRVADIGTG